MEYGELSPAAIAQATDVRGLMDRIHSQQADIERLQAELAATEMVGVSRGDDVRVTVRGNGQVVAVVIHDQALRENDAHELGELVKEAVNDGLRKVAEAGTARFRPIVDAAGRA